ncbi:MAG: ATP-binding protein [Pseudobdellovibrionaceae bacterium]|nr:ATP-binding protein [Pseudobdellovibrionaceae bacterium]
MLDHSTLSDDEKDQAWQTIMASLGESRLSFELNVDKLPHQLHYAVNDVKKVVNLTWNFDLNAKDEIKHILVTLLDVSSEVAARQEIARQNQEFEIIRQLVDSGAKKSVQFFNAGDQLIEENERLIRAPVMDRDSIKILFVNTHTLKGAARTLQFRELANALHQVESYYSAIIKENQALDQARALREFLAARSVYQRYYKANRDILGRTDDVKRVSVDRDFLHQNVKFLRHLSDVDVLPFELRDVIHTWRHELTQLIFMSMPMILDDIMQQSEKIAKDLGREPPRVQLDADDILVSYSQELALKNAFIHMLRNALDHGIETPRARLDKGKPAQGTIQGKAWEQNGTIHLEFKDDGKGLALGRIRDLTKVDAQTKPDVLASRIFEAGFSTAETVSQMSGRGIGLGAVRQFIEAEKGTVTIKLGRLIQAEGEFYEFSLHLTLPANASANGPLVTSIAS